jgi:lipoate---protein ligase
MRLLSLCLPTPAENLALEELLLEEAEAGRLEDEVLRLWPAESEFVVVGRGSRVRTEVHLAEAERGGVPVLRRSSGGAAIVAGPGCLMYALLLSYERRPHLRMLDACHREVMQGMVAALRPLEPSIDSDGTCDLVVAGKKVSGNSLRCRRQWVLYHGTLLLDMDLGLIDQFLLHPPREPEYRQGRLHTEFVANLGLPAGAVARGLAQQWQADQPLDWSPPQADIERLVSEKYSAPAWTFER